MKSSETSLANSISLASEVTLSLSETRFATVNSIESEISAFSFEVAVIVTVPSATPVTTPFSSTVAFVASEVVHSTAVFAASLGVTVAVNGSV